MENIEFDYTIPESKADIKIIDYLKWLNIEKENLVEELQVAMMLEIFCDIPVKYTSFMKQSDIIEITENLKKTFSHQPELKYTFDFKGVRYGLIPDFDKHITAGELYDLDEWGLENDWVRMLSILYRPIVKEDKASGLYQIEPYTGTSHTKFSELGLDVLESTQVFFYRSVKDLLKATLKYSVNQISQSKKNLDLESLKELDLLKNMVATQKYFG